MVLRRRAEVADPVRLGRLPALAVVDPPGVDHDQGRLGGAEAVGHLDDAPGVVREPPGPHVQVGALVVDEQRRLEPGDLADRLDELGVVGQERLRVDEGREPVLVDPRLRLLRPSSGQTASASKAATDQRGRMPDILMTGTSLRVIGRGPLTSPAARPADSGTGRAPPAGSAASGGFRA